MVANWGPKATRTVKMLKSSKMPAPGRIKKTTHKKSLHSDKRISLWTE